MVKLILNGCELSTKYCGRITSTVDLSTCSSGGTGGGGDTINGLSINGCILSIDYTDVNGISQTKSVDISSCDTNTGDTIVDLSVIDCAVTLSYIDKDGVAQNKIIDISSCVPVSVTELTNFTWDSVNGNTVITYIKSDGTTGTISTTILPTFVNTDNQQLISDNTGSVVITLTPLPQPDGSINYTVKADLKVASTTPSGGINGLKQDAGGNFYVDILDGSETKVIAGTGTTVTGSGTIASPYVINATPPVGQFVQLAPGGGGSAPVAANGLLAFDTLVSSYGTLITPNAGASSMTLAAGFVYEIEAVGLFKHNNATSALSYGIFDGAALIGTQAFAQPVTHPTSSNTSQQIAKAYVVATTTKTITVKCIQIVSSGAVSYELQSPSFVGFANATNYNGTVFNGYFTAKVIGTI